MIMTPIIVAFLYYEHKVFFKRNIKYLIKSKRILEVPESGFVIVQPSTKCLIGFPPVFTTNYRLSIIKYLEALNI